MLKLRILLLTLLAIISCNCQNTVKKSPVQKEIIEDKYVLAFLGEKNYEILSSVQEVIRFKIKKHLLEGTTNEYSNKLIIQDTLTNSKRDDLIKQLLNDTSYNWTAVTKTKDFEPTHQVLLKSNNGRLNLLIDKEFKNVGFINLEGQKMVVVTKEFSLFLSNM